jgi:hypothetical protein
VPKAQSKYLSKWIKVDKWDYFKNRPQDFFLSSLLIIIFLNMKPLSEVVPGPDPSSVTRLTEVLLELHNVLFVRFAGD